VVHAVDADPEQVEERRQQHRDEQRIEAERRADGDDCEGAGHHQRRVGDVDDVEHAEGDGEPRRRGGVKAAEQQPADDPVQQQHEVGIHPPPPPRRPPPQAPGGP
jgi:hypothetical protein